MNGAALRLAIPSKGMEDAALAFLSSCGLRVNRSNPRQYRATVGSVRGVEVLFQRAPDIVEKVAEAASMLVSRGMTLSGSMNEKTIVS